MPIKKLFAQLLYCLVWLLSGIELNAQQPAQQPSSNWTKGPSDRFTGTVWVDYFVNDTINDFLASKVLFESGARSNWHWHLGRQIILGVDGEGYYKEKCKPIRILKKGDVVVIEAGTIHSHGSVHAKKFLQAVMMNDIRKKDATTWLNRVTEKDIKE